jgi:hypothetical protein
MILQNHSSYPVAFIAGAYEAGISRSYRFHYCNNGKMYYSLVGSNEREVNPTGHGEKWEEKLSKYLDSTEIFLAYHADSANKYIDNYGCDSLGKRNDLVLKRFDVTVDYLKKNNWTLTYP